MQHMLRPVTPLYLISSWSKLSRSRPERSAMDRVLLNFAHWASLIFACIFAWAMMMMMVMNDYCFDPSRIEVLPVCDQQCELFSWLYCGCSGCSGAPGRTFPNMGCDFLHSVLEKFPEEPRTVVLNGRSEDPLQVPRNTHFQTLQVTLFFISIFNKYLQVSF